MKRHASRESRNEGSILGVHKNIGMAQTKESFKDDKFNRDGQGVSQHILTSAHDENWQPRITLGTKDMTVLTAPFMNRTPRAAKV